MPSAKKPTIPAADKQPALDQSPEKPEYSADVPLAQDGPIPSNGTFTAPAPAPAPDVA